MPIAADRRLIIQLGDESPRPRMHEDGWQNLATGLGTIGRDKRKQSTLVPEDFTHEELDEFVEGDDMAARIVQTLPEDMMREGWEVQIEGDPEAAEATMAKVDELELNARVQDALEDARTHGGAAILLGLDDGARDLSQPVNVKRVHDIGWLTTLPSNELLPANWYREISEAHYGTVSIYQIREQQFGTETFLQNLSSMNTSQMPLIHESRLLKFHGERLSRRRTRQKRGWGGSVLVRCWDVIRDFQTTWGSAAALLQDFSQAVMRLKGLTEAMESGNEAAIVKRAQLIDLTRSVSRCVLLDEGEEFERKATPISGLPEMLQQFALRLSAAARMPVTKLMGQAPAGLNATGAADVRFWYDHVKAAQTRKALPILNRFLKLLFLAKDGPTKGVEPENWSIKFRSQYQLTETETADVRLKSAQADALWIANQVLHPYEVAISRFGGDEFSLDIHIDTADREDLLEDPATIVPGTPADVNTPPSNTVNPNKTADPPLSKAGEGVGPDDQAAGIPGPGDNGKARGP